MRIQTFVSVHDLRWNEYKIDFARIARAVIQAAKARRVRECNPGSCENCKFSQVGAPMKSDTEISIILTNDSEIRKLNKKYRGKDTPTNVLSFETGDSELLGDIFISFDTVIRESAGARAFVDHATHMVAHGILHLLGYDHLNDSDATKMEALEVKILAKLGIDNPYKDGADKNPDKKKSALLAICSFLLGGIASLGFAPFYLWPLTIVSVAIAYYLIFAKLDRCKSVSYILSPAFCFGAGYAAASFWWVLNSIYVVPELAAQFAIWTVPGIIGIALAGGVIFGLPFVITAFTKVNDWRRTIVFAASWTFVLWLREWMLTGFPWNPIANIAMPWPAFSNSMSLWGALGLTFIIVGLIASVAEIIKGTRIPFYIFISLLIVGVGYGHWNILQSVEFCKQDCRHPVIRIVQPAGSAEQKATHSREQALARAEENLNKLMELSAGKNYVSSQGAANAESPGSGRDKGIENIQNNHNSDFSNADRVPDNFARATQNFRDDTPDIIVWPETAYPYVVVGDNPSSPSFAEARFPPAKEIGLPVVAGATLVSNPYSAVREDTKVYNSMIVSDASGAIQKIYSKSHLVPFGEYRPFGDIIPTPGQLSRGQGPEIIAVSNEQIANSNFSFVPAICYEVIFSDSLIPADGKGGMGDGINAIINITNDTWFGRTPGTYQHLDMARRQAIETGLPIVRANYSGISAFIASDGRVVSSLPIGAAGILDGSVSGAHITPYRRIGRDWIMFIILAVSGMAVLLFRQVRRQ